ncbi:MAG: cyclopropane-fatty-acyl-phospholipid synthase family protein [Gemmatimonadetes bacterium]|nr:cyclopropane-fatty-acyl-phospholipid synthase family protein [Gemmatimonadota bacterium]
MPSTRKQQKDRGRDRQYTRSRPEGRRTPSREVREAATTSTPDSRPPREDEVLTGPALSRSRVLLDALFGPLPERNFAVRFWDGSEDRPSGEVAFVLALRHPGALRRMLLPPTQAAMGAAYTQGHIDLEGSAEAATAVAEQVADRLRHPGRLLRLVTGALRLPRGEEAEDSPNGVSPARAQRGRRHSRARDAAAVRSHYDVGNDFYRLFLDRRLVYSCGYFPSESTDLDAAQEAKLDHICRKLRLSPGDRLLDIGCGWGALVLHAVERYGVRALGITLSDPQARQARERIAASGLQDKCAVEVRDYRDLPSDMRFDKIASVGMVEHVGRRRMRTYFREVACHLEPGGLFLNHGIVSLEGPPDRLQRVRLIALRPLTSFIPRYVFPDSELVSVAELTAPGEREGLELRDVESLREHYARTLRHWVRRLEANHEAARRLVGEATYRVWRIYMAGSAHFFTAGHIGVVQTLWGKPAADGSVSLPPTRADLYAG